MSDPIVPNNMIPIILPSTASGAHQALQKSPLETDSSAIPSGIWKPAAKAPKKARPWLRIGVAAIVLLTAGFLGIGCKNRSKPNPEPSAPATEVGSGKGEYAGVDVAANPENKEPVTDPVKNDVKPEIKEPKTEPVK